MDDNDITELIIYSKEEIENVLTNENSINIEQLEQYLGDWVKQTCFNKREISYYKNIEVEDRDYVTLTHAEFNEKYSKILNLQLVEHPYNWLSVPIEMINNWEKRKRKLDDIVL